MWVISAIADGSSVWKNGTLLTRSQVWMKLRRRLSAAKPVAKIPVHKPKVAIPQIMTKAPSRWPRGVRGTSSPYPVVVSVTTAHHNACGNEPNAAGCSSRSSTCMAAEERNSTIRNSAKTLASGLASSTNTRASWAKPGEFCASLRTHSDASSQAVGCATPQASAIGTGKIAIRSTIPEAESR